MTAVRQARALARLTAIPSLFRVFRELTPKRTIGSYSLLLGDVVHFKLDRGLSRQKIKQVDIQIECSGNARAFGAWRRYGQHGNRPLTSEEARKLFDSIESITLAVPFVFTAAGLRSGFAPKPR
jgi:hypothetical protein